MLSPGRKVRWLCPECGSESISDQSNKVYGRRGICADCDTWWPWRTRIKVSVKRAEQDNLKGED